MKSRIFLIFIHLFCALLPVFSQQAVTQLILVDSATGEDIGPLVDGQVLNLAVTGEQLNVRAETNPPLVGSVRFAYDSNPEFRLESTSVYAFAGNESHGYNDWTPSLGTHTIIATPFTVHGGVGEAGTALTVNFDVIDEVVTNSELMTAMDEAVISVQAAPSTEDVTIAQELEKSDKVALAFDGVKAVEMPKNLSADEDGFASKLGISFYLLLALGYVLVFLFVYSMFRKFG